VENNDARISRVSGSPVDGDDRDGSDLDLPADPTGGKTSLISLVWIKRGLEALPGAKNAALAPMALRERAEQCVFQEAAEPIACKTRKVPDPMSGMPDTIGNVESDFGDISRDSRLLDGKTQRTVADSLIAIGRKTDDQMMRFDSSLKETTPALWQGFPDACES
jgi:hypothetical protein